LIEDLSARLEAVDRRLAGVTHPPRVVCVEWLDPLMCVGHWVPDQVRRAGGVEVIGTGGGRSRAMTWAEVFRARPKLVVLMPCGVSPEAAQRELAVLTAQPEWRRLFDTHPVVLVDGSRHFNSPGPGLVDGVELLARLIHPDRFPDAASTPAWRPALAACQRSSVA
jgi:iron complex transport system substrate-binding protein